MNKVMFKYQLVALTAYCHIASMHIHCDRDVFSLSIEKNSIVDFVIATKSFDTMGDVDYNPVATNIIRQSALLYNELDTDPYYHVQAIRITISTNSIRAPPTTET